MKFDKESVMKNQFWLLLAVAMPLAIVVIFILLTVVSAEISRNRKDLESKLSATKSGGSAKNQEWINIMEKNSKKAEAMKAVVWGKAYEDQKDLSTWPEGGKDPQGERLLVGMDELFRDGLFVLEVKGDRGQPAGAEGAKPAPAPAPDNKAAEPAKKEDDKTADAKKDDEEKAKKEEEEKAKEEERKPVKQFQGTIVQSRIDWLEVKGSTETKFFYRTVGMKVKMDGKDYTSFTPALQRGDKVEITYIRGKYFNDPLTPVERDVYMGDDGYKTQLHDILKMVDPVNTKGEGVVILPNWRYKESDLPPTTAKFFHYVEWKSGKERGTKDISDETWMAQEDLWIQREIYRLVRLSNDYVSKFERKSGKPGDAEGVFENPYWTLELKLVGKNLSAKVTNKLSQKQKLDVAFKVRLQKNADPYLVPIEGEPLLPNKSKETVKEDVTGKGIFDVEQAITWETAAVKRIDQISIGSVLAEDCCHSHRTFPDGLKPFKKTEAAAAAPPAGAGPMGPMGPMMDVGKGGFGMRGQAAQNLTDNGLSPDRYLEVTTQARRLPIGVSLIVDQDHVDRVLTAFANSKLRFLTTQVIINRYPNSVRPDDSTTNTPTPMTPFRGPADVAGPKMRRPGGGDFPMMPFGRPFSGSGFGTNTPVGNPADEETNVEMVIYGIVSMYERYPPLPPEIRKTPGT
jgi:hypothetical protein